MHAAATPHLIHLPNLTLCKHFVSAGGGKGPGSRDFIRLQKQNVELNKENNLLKYKVELLLDMLAASNADFLVMKRELEALKKTQTKKR